MTLTAKQEAFALAVFEGASATEAYRRIYDVSSTTKDSTVWRKAAELMDNGKVSARLAELRAVVAERSQVTIQQVIEELAAIAFTDLRDVVSWDGDTVILKDSAELSPAAAASVREVKQTRTVTRGKDDYEQIRDQREIKLHDKVQALKLLGTHLGMFVERVEHDVSGNVVIMHTRPIDVIEAESRDA